MSAVLAATLGFMLLAQLLKNRGDVILSTMAMTIFLMSAVLSLTAESLELGRQEGLYPTIVVSVILAFTGQALFGLSILRTGYLPVWVGWTAVIWNLGWLVIFAYSQAAGDVLPLAPLCGAARYWNHAVGKRIGNARHIIPYSRTRRSGF